MAIEAESNTIKPNYQVLRPGSIEKVFTDCVMDLGRIVVLDSIDILPDGFRVSCHDLYGQLPEIVVKNSGDTLRDTARLGCEVCKRLAIVKLRDEMARWMPGSNLLRPTRVDGKVVVGLLARPRTWIIDGASFLEAYHELHSQVVG